jgi:hypothetical protein
MGFYPAAMLLQQDTTHKNKRITLNNTPRSQTKHSTQSYRNSKGQIVHNDYNIKK